MVVTLCDVPLMTCVPVVNVNVPTIVIAPRVKLPVAITRTPGAIDDVWPGIVTLVPAVFTSKLKVIPLPTVRPSVAAGAAVCETASRAATPPA